MDGKMERTVVKEEEWQMANTKEERRVVAGKCRMQCLGATV